MNQLSFLPSAPRAHRRDPESSHEAARTAHAFAAKHKQIVLRAVCLYPNSTSAELAGHIKLLDLTETRRRLTDLLEDGDITRTDPGPHTVPCAVSGRRVCRWRPA